MGKINENIGKSIGLHLHTYPKHWLSLKSFHPDRVGVLADLLAVRNGCLARLGSPFMASLVLDSIKHLLLGIAISAHETCIYTMT